jgi:hypothetical protein
MGKILDGNIDEVKAAVEVGISEGRIGIPELRGLLDAEGVQKKRQGVIAYLGDTRGGGVRYRLACQA